MQRNLISTNYYAGVLINGTGANNNQIRGNYIGTDVTGNVALPNGSGSLYAGIYLGGFGASVAGTIIGGTGVGSRNVIAGNNGDGIAIWDGVSGTIIQGNYIGVAADGVTALGNNAGADGGGVAVRNFSSNNVIGGAGVDEGNLIANNTPAGVRAYSGTGNSVRGNQIRNNNGLGIDWDVAGVTPNDVDDPDAGPNNLQNFPVFGTATLAGAGPSLNVQVSVDSLYTVANMLVSPWLRAI